MDEKNELKLIVSQLYLVENTKKLQHGNRKFYFGYSNTLNTSQNTEYPINWVGNIFQYARPHYLRGKLGSSLGPGEPGALKKVLN